MTAAARDAGMPDDSDAINDYLEWLSGGQADPTLRKTFISRGPEAVDFLRNRGVPLTVVRGAADYYYPDAPGSRVDACTRSNPGTRASYGSLLNGWPRHPTERAG